MAEPESSNWTSYDKARSERATLPPLVIDGTKFVFPSSAPAEFGLNLLNLVKKFGDRIPEEETIALIPDLIGTEDAERLAKMTTFHELMGIVDDLLRQYGFVEPEGTKNGNPTKPRRERRAKVKTSTSRAN